MSIEKGYFYMSVDSDMVNECDKVILYYLDIDKDKNIYFREFQGYLLDGTKNAWRYGCQSVYRYRISTKEGVVFKRMVWFYDDETLNSLSYKEKKNLAIQKLLEEEINKKKELEERISNIDTNIAYLQCYKSIIDWEDNK